MTRRAFRRFRTAVGAIVVLVGGVVAAQTQPAPLPMLISGRIVSAATGRPIPGARANVSIADYGVATTIGAEGRYVATLREPGQHRVTASAPGYLSSGFGTHVPPDTHRGA